MTFNEWFAQQQLIGGSTVEIAYDIAKKAWEASRKDLKDTILNRSGGHIVINEKDWEKDE